jgi:putative membrane protein
MQTYDPGYENNHNWKLQHPTALLFGFLGILRSSGVPLLLIFFVFSSPTRSPFSSMIMFGLLLFVPMVAYFMRYISYRYRLEAGQITIREGIFSRKIRRIPVRRIHNVNTHQSLLARALKVVRLDVETAGGGASEASFTSLTESEASLIQNFVKREKAGIIAQDPQAEIAPVTLEDPPESEPIYKISLTDILVAGATTNRMGVIFVSLAVAFQYLQEYIATSQDTVWVQYVFEYVEVLRQQNGIHLILYGILLFFVLFFLAWIISILSALLRFYGFRLTYNDEDLKIKAGLFTVREFTIPLNRIQALEAQVSAFRRPFNLVQIKVMSAGHIGAQDQRRQDADILAPITRTTRTGFFVDTVFPRSSWDKADWHGVHSWHRTRHFRILAAMVFAILWAINTFLNPSWVPIMAYYILAVAALPVCWFIAHQTYKQTAFAEDHDFIYLRTGFIALHFWVIPVRNIQNVRVSQTPFQRTRHIASLVIDVAGGGREAVVPNIPLKTCWEMFNRFATPKPR